MMRASNRVGVRDIAHVTAYLCKPTTTEIMTKIIGCIQVKGGAGRSTVSTNLAAELAKSGKTVLIDCDMPQGTSASWYSVRRQNDVGLLENLKSDTAINHFELAEKIKKHADADYIVLDGAPRIAEMARAMLMLSDLALVPVAASRAEMWATGDIVDLIEEASQSKDVLARMVWTRYRPNTKLVKELATMAENDLGLEALDTTLNLRVGYIDALGSGLSVTEMPEPSARAEIMSLGREVQSLLEK